MAAPTQQITGLVSGMDTQSIVTQLMEIEKQPYEKLNIKKETEKLRLQAYQAVNSMLLKFKNAVSNLASQKLWNSKSATSTNENSLIATANQYAANGSYTFRVAQKASQTQYTSKGFADKQTTFGQPDENGVYDALGSITVASPKSRVDTSAKLESLNGGAGVYRGSIRITDSRGNASVVDLSGCETLNDVVSTINNNSTARVTASIGRNDQGENFLQVVDTAEGTGALKIQNVGQGSTAKDLGLTADFTEDVNGVKSIQGRNIYYLGRDSYLSELNDGLGVEDGKISIYMSEGGTGVGSVEIDLNGAKNVADVLDRVNNAISDASAGFPSLAGLKLGLNAEKNGFEFTGAKDGASYLVYNSWEIKSDAFNPETAQQLGIGGSYIADASGVLSGQRVLGDADSPMLKNLSGAAGSGIGTAGSGGQNQVPVPGGLRDDTLVEYLNGGKGLDIGAGFIINFNEGNGLTNSRTTNNIIDQADLKSFMEQPGRTVGEVLDYIEQRIAAVADEQNIQGLKGITFEVKDGGIVVNGASAAHGFEFTGDLAESLGLSRGSGKFNGDGDISDEWKAALDDLWSVTDVRNGNQSLVDGTKLVDMKGDTTVTGHDGTIGTIVGNGTEENPQGIGALRTGAGDFIIKIGGVTYDMQSVVDEIVNTLGDDATIEDIFNGINAELADQGVTNAPYLYYNWVGTGFQWRNVDLDESFEVSGKFAEAFGLNKNYDPTGLDTSATITDSVQKQLNPTMPGYTVSLYPMDEAATNAITVGQLNGGKGLSLKGDMSDSIDIEFFAQNDETNKVTLSVTKQEIFDTLAANGVSNPQDATIAQYYSTINSLIADKVQLAKDNGDLGADAKFEIGCNEYGLFVLRGHSGDADLNAVSVGGALVENGTWGVGNIKFLDEGAGKEYDYQMSYLNPVRVEQQTVTGLGDIVLNIGGSEKRLSTAGLNEESTLKDLMDKLNSELAREGVAGVSFIMNTNGTGLAIENDSTQSVTVVNTKDANTLARDLGFINYAGDDLTVEGRSVYNSSSLGRAVMSRASSIASFAGAKTLELGTIVITNTTGGTLNVDITNCKTVGDFIDAINMNKGFGVYASLNAAGDGIVIEEYWEDGNEPAADKRTGNIRIADQGSGNAASILGVATTGTGWVEDMGFDKTKSVINGSINKTLQVSGSDTLESLMNRLSEMGFKTAIVNDGSGANPYRLTVSSSVTGEAADFILDAEGLEFLGLAQKSRGKDAKILYGDPNSGDSPIMLSSSTNTNSTAINGLTLEIKDVSETYTTITVDTDKSKVVDAITEMATAYNELNDLISYLDGYDPETNEKGVLFGDNNLRNLIKSIDDMFYMVYNPEGTAYGESDEKKTWTWMDMGISFSTNQTNAATGKSGSGWYSTMELDTEILESMVASNWDKLYAALASQQNSASSKLKGNAAASASFNFKHDVDPVTGLPIIPASQSDVNGAINNDYATSMANGNGFVANKTIAEGENQYTVFFQGTVTMSRLSIYHPDGNTFVPGYGTGNAMLKDFTVEYLDAATGKWEVMREITGNTSSATHLGAPGGLPTDIQAIRITGKSTNAADGKFRLLDIQVFEDTGLAGKMNRLTTSLGDVTTGFMAERTTEIEDAITNIEDQMARLEEKLEAKEASLWRRFTAMETAMSKLQYQGNQLSSMLGSMSSSSK